MVVNKFVRVCGVRDGIFLSIDRRLYLPKVLLHAVKTQEDSRLLIRYTKTSQLCEVFVYGWATGIEPAAIGATGRCSTIELRPPYAIYCARPIVAVQACRRARRGGLPMRNPHSGVSLQYGSKSFHAKLLTQFCRPLRNPLGRRGKEGWEEECPCRPRFSGKAADIIKSYLRQK